MLFFLNISSLFFFTPSKVVLCYILHGFYVLQHVFCFNAHIEISVQNKDDLIVNIC